MITVEIVPDDGGPPEEVPRVQFAWPLDGEAPEDLRWYLEDYLQAPFGVREDRGLWIHDRLADRGEWRSGRCWAAASSANVSPLRR
jgi:hypothetical protein